SADKNTFLTHAHMERSENNFEPLLLVCRNDDPLLTHLQNFGVVTEAHPLDEIQESFHESVELLWLRSDSHEEIKTLSQNLLAPSGICLADHKDSPRLFYRSNE